MKAIKTITMAALMAASITGLASAAGTASAPTVVYITGSTAYRANAVLAMENIMVPSTLKKGWDANSADANVATHAVIYGSLKTTGSYVAIYTDWNGSAAGDQPVSGATVSTPTQQLFPLFYLVPPADYTVAADYTANMAVSTTSVNGGDGSFSDVAQATTGWLGTVSYPTAYNSGGTPITPKTQKFPQLSEITAGVGIVPFVFVTSPNSPITNMNPQLAQALWANGQESLAQYDGVAADESKYAYAMGRNPDSGTRLAAFSETGVGALSDVLQQQPLNGSNAWLNGVFNTPIANIKIWPTDSTSIVNGDAYPAGDSGYSSGGGIAKDLTNSVAALNGFLVSYLGSSDAVNFLGAKSSSDGSTATYPTINPKLLPAGTALSYNGFTLPISVTTGPNTAAQPTGFAITTAITTASDSTTATSVTTTTQYSGTASATLGGEIYPNGWVETATITNTPIVQGQYTYWSTEHLYYNPAITSGDKFETISDLSNDLFNTDGQITITSMNVSRTADGGIVGSNNY